MRKLTLLSLIALTLAVPVHAARGRNQSYFSYDDGGTIVRQGEDGKEIDGRLNLPLFPGDEVITSRRGRSEIRLSDGNMLSIDRASSVLFHSILDSYDGDNEATVVELRFGKVMVLRAGDARDSIRLDTPSASYFAGEEAIFSLATDTHGADRVTVFVGNIEVRTPARTTKLHRGEGASIDGRGMYSVAADATSVNDDFERWFLRRADKWASSNPRYLDQSMAPYEEDLNDHGSWTTVAGYGNVWRPSGVAVGWRPYYYGHWTRSYSGCLTWVSYEPWGWAPYHYGRWAFDEFYGWFWVPGTGYAPAWVYWWYGPSYVGWAPAGWYDCYRPYNDWAYRPYHRAGLDNGYGFYGRVRTNDVDLRPWTFVEGGTLVSNRVDRAAVTTDVIRGRLQRDPNGFATISNGAARFTRNEMKDPTAAINRRWTTGGVQRTGGTTTQPPADVTPFFRRDADLSGNVRERVMRGRPADGGTRAGVPAGTGTSSGGLAPIGGGSLAPIGGGNVAPIGGGSLAPIAPTRSLESGESMGRIKDISDIPRTDISNPTDRNTARGARDDGGRIERSGPPPVANPAPATTPPPAEGSRDSGTNWRDRVSRSSSTPSPTVGRSPEVRDPAVVDSWRNRQSSRDTTTRDDSTDTVRARSASSGNRDSDVSRRVIDRIGGARVTPSTEAEKPRDSGSRDSGSKSSGSRDSGSKNSGSRDTAKDSGSRDSSSNKESAPAPRSKDSGSRSSGGHIKRDH